MAAAARPIDSSFTVHYTLRIFTIPRPEDVESSAGDVIHNWGGVKIVRWSEQVVIEYGRSVKVEEAETLAFSCFFSSLLICA